GLLILISGFIATPLGIAIGVYSATRASRWIDHAISLVTLVLASLPAFVVAIALIYLLATNVFHLMPPTSIVDPNAPIWTQPSVFVLPMLSLILTVIPYAIRMVRASMVEVLQSEY